MNEEILKDLVVSLVNKTTGFGIEEVQEIVGKRLNISCSSDIALKYLNDLVQIIGTDKIKKVVNTSNKRTTFMFVNCSTAWAERKLRSTKTMNNKHEQKNEEYNVGMNRVKAFLTRQIILAKKIEERGGTISKKEFFSLGIYDSISPSTVNYWKDSLKKKEIIASYLYEKNLLTLKNATEVAVKATRLYKELFGTEPPEEIEIERKKKRKGNEKKEQKQPTIPQEKEKKILEGGELLDYLVNLFTQVPSGKVIPISEIRKKMVSDGYSSLGNIPEAVKTCGEEIGLRTKLVTNKSGISETGIVKLAREEEVVEESTEETETEIKKELPIVVFQSELSRNEMQEKLSSKIVEESQIDSMHIYSMEYDKDNVISIIDLIRIKASMRGDEKIFASERIEKVISEFFEK